MALAPGDRVEYAFESDEPVDFNIRYHEGKAVVMPVVRDELAGDAGVYVARLAQDYCLTWEAGAVGAMIDYRIRVSRALLTEPWHDVRAAGDGSAGTV